VFDGTTERQTYRPPALDLEDRTMGSMKEFMAARKADKANGNANHVELAPKQVVTFGCGCKFMARYLQGAQCVACQRRRRNERQKAAQANPKGLPFRLPDGATFSATYDATAEQWFATLSVGTTIWEASGPSVHNLLRRLGEQCWLAQQPADDFEDITRAAEEIARAREEGRDGCFPR
jgi:hypothetical protein